MKRSVYSLVLSDDVVEAIDNLAYSLGVSRSNLINQILAEKVRLVTPEQRMNDIFNQVENHLVEERYQIQSRQSNTLLSIKSSIKYKYRPTVRYSLELFKNPKEGIGRLKVSFRTQNQILLQLVDNFFSLWSSLEDKYIVHNIVYYIEPSRYVRVFSTISKTTKDIGVAISNYIMAFDDALKQYFANYNNLRLANSIVEDAFKQYLNNKDIVI